MHKHQLALAALLAVALGGCGAADDKAPVQTRPAIENPEAYFGVSPCECYEYVATDDANQRLGVAVEAITDFYTDGDPQNLVRYRLNGGLVVREDVVKATDPDLLLSRVFVDKGQDDLNAMLMPPVKLLSAEGDAGKPIQQDVALHPVGATEDIPVSFRADYVPGQTVNIVAEIEGENGGQGAQAISYEATKVIYSTGNQSWSEQPRWFVPNVGVVQLDLTVAGTRHTWKLVRKRTLGGNCPLDNAAEAPSDSCGSSVAATE